MAIRVRDLKLDGDAWLDLDRIEFLKEIKLLVSVYG